MTPDERGARRGTDPVPFIAWVAVWGTLAGVGATLAAPVFGRSLVTWFVAGAGAIVGGLGAIGSSALVLRKRNVPATWKLAGLLGIPFGLALGALGVLELFVLPSIDAAGGSWNPALWLPVLGAVVVLGVALTILVGANVVRALAARVAENGAHRRSGRAG